MNRRSSDTDHPRPRGGADSRRGFARALTTEWERTARHRASIHRAKSWGVVNTHFDDLDELLALAGYDRRDDHDAERVLRRLVERAQSDELAARVVVQRIVPGLISATRHRPSDMSADDALQELVAAAWIAVRSYDPKRSPSCISAALINDAVYRVFKSDRRRREKRPEVLVDPQDWRSLTATDDQVLDRVREVLIEARVHGIDPVNLEALRRVLLTGSTERVAEAMGISPRAVRYRCSRVAGELAAIAQVA